MNESTAAIHPLHMRNTTDFVFSGIHGIQNVKQLHGTEKQSGRKYLDQLSVILSNNRLVHSGYFGAHSQIYYPDNDKNVAAKIFDTRAKNERDFAKLRRAIDDRIIHIGLNKIGIKNRDEAEKYRDKERAYKLGVDELKKILEDRSYIKFANHETMPSFEDLDPTEKAFLYIAWENALCQKLYQPYILPAVFIAYKTPEDVLEIKKQYTPEEIIRLKGLGDEFNENGFRIISKKGETAYAMVQDFQEIDPIVFKHNFVNPNISNKQKKQLLELANKLKSVRNETGYYPDANPEKNIMFNKEGNLILIDTNHVVNSTFERAIQSYAMDGHIEDLMTIAS